MISKRQKENVVFEPAYKKLLVWKISDELAKQIYKATKDFPKAELYGLTAQLRRSVLSIPLNILEGYSRNNKNEFRQFLRIALGSLAETRYLLEFAYYQGYLKRETFGELMERLELCGRLLWKLFKSQT